jgi:type 1 fimbriae regulatory protein FimB
LTLLGKNIILPSKEAGMTKDTIKYWTEDEQQRFFKVIKEGRQSRDIAMFSLMLHLGLRLMEALHIKLDDLTHKESKLYVRRLKNGKNFRFNLMDKDTKLIRKWLKERKSYPDAKINPYLFISRRSANGMITPQGIQFKMLQYCQKAGIPKDKCHPHVLRHTCAVNILMSGHDVFTVKEILGHRNIQSSMEYLELGLPEQVKRLNGVLEKAHRV